MNMHKKMRIKRLPTNADNTEKKSDGSSLDEIINAKLREIRKNLDRHRDKNGHVNLQEIQIFLESISVADTLLEEYNMNPSKRRRC